MNETLKSIFDRRSIRAYKDEPLTEEQLKTLLDAAQAAPSAINSQPWHFSVVSNAEMLDEFNGAVRDLMLRKNPANARAKDPAFHVFYHAPTVIFISTPVSAPTPFNMVDCGIAVQTIALAAHSIGLGSVILGMPRDIFADEKYRKMAKFPENYEYAIAIAVGTPAGTKEAHPILENEIDIIR